MKKITKIVAGIATISLLNIGVSSLPALAAAQRISYYIAGACLDNYDIDGEYSLYEAEDDNCTLQVKVTPKNVVRKATLQYWNEETLKWTKEDAVNTDKRGWANLKIDPICEDDLWCDGTYKYRILVAKKGSNPADTSEEFDVVFYPDDGNYDY